MLAQAYYQIAKAGKAWEQAAEQTAWTIRNYSELFYKYPVSAGDVASPGPVGGMEYPMFVMVHYGDPNDDPKSIFGTLDHEHGHEWFPMIVGLQRAALRVAGRGLQHLHQRLRATSAHAGHERVSRATSATGAQTVENRIDAPLMTPPDRIDARALGALGYRKPAVVLLALRDNVVGRATFDRAFREYTQRWAFKHPSPGDFFRTIENVSGMDLGWFWRSFWYSTDVLDIGIDNVTMRQQQGQNYRGDRAAAEHAGAIPGSACACSSGTTPRRTSRIPVEVWAQGERIEAVVAVGAAVIGARLWPEGIVPDWNTTNDAWGTPVPVTRGRRRRRVD